jgi:RimJ/RimL family protein N-acetyltransferase
VDALHHVLSNPQVHRYFPRTEPPSCEQVEKIIARQLAHWQEHNCGWWAVLWRENQELIGWCGLQFLPEFGETEVAYLLSKPYWGKGLATEAAQAAVQFGFQTLGLERLVAIAHVENAASQRVIEKLGMSFVEQLHLWGIECYRYSLPRAAFASPATTSVQMSAQTCRLYSDLAWLWPMWGDASEYASYCAHITQLIRQYARRDVCSLLNLGCGGGKNAFNLKQQFAVTGLDTSPAMLDLARRLNPECRFVRADMRTFSWPERFDAILIDDAICYMTTEVDLRAVFERAYAHLNVGGVMVCGPDDTPETFVQNCTKVTHAAAAPKPERVEVVFIENNFDPAPEDTKYEALMIYLIRENGQLRIEHDLHHLGLFPLDVWRRLLRDVGFELHETEYAEDSKRFVEFACIKSV